MKPLFLDLSAKPGPGGVKTADDIIAENSRLRDLVRRMIPGVEEAFAAAKEIGESVKGICALKGVDSSEMDEVLEYWTALLREAHEAVGESMKEGGEK